MQRKNVSASPPQFFLNIQSTYILQRQLLLHVQTLERDWQKLDLRQLHLHHHNKVSQIKNVSHFYFLIEWYGYKQTASIKRNEKLTFYIRFLDFLTETCNTQNRKMFNSP